MKIVLTNCWIFHNRYFIIISDIYLPLKQCGILLAAIDADVMVERPNMSVEHILPIRSARSFNKNSGRGSLRSPLAVFAKDLAKHT